MEEKKRKSQKRAERQRRRQERRAARTGEAPPPPAGAAKKRKSLPGFMAKYRREVSKWLRNYMFLMVKSEDAGVPFIKDMTREERNKFIQEYVDVSDFRTELEEYLMTEDDAAQAAKK